MTASGLGFAGGGDGVLRAFDLKTGKVLWTFQTGRQIAAGPTIFSAGGKEYVAITVGGTPTSSGGGLASQLQVFAIGGSKAESPKPLAASSAPVASTAARSRPPRRRRAFRAAATTATAQGARSLIDGGAVALAPWTAVDARTWSDVGGRVVLGGKPVVGARVASTATCCRA